MATVDLHGEFTSNNPVDSEGMTWMTYVCDDGRKLPIRIKELYGRKLGFDPLPAGGIPSNERVAPGVTKVEPRRVYAVDSSGKIRQSFKIGKPTEAIYREGGTIKIARRGTTQSITLYVTGSVGEKRHYSTPEDTSQQGFNPDQLLI